MLILTVFLLLSFEPMVGTEELGHLEMVGTLVHQLTRNLTDSQIKTAGFDTYFVDHTTGVYPQFASGYPWSASTMQVTGDIIADLTEDLAAEQKARLTYDNILRLSDDPDVNDVIRFLREREIVHFQRFGETNHTDLSRFYLRKPSNRLHFNGFSCNMNFSIASATSSHRLSSIISWQIPV